MSTLLPVNFAPPETGPVHPYGLYAAAQLFETTAAEAARRWLPSGVLVRPMNYGSENGLGVWGAPWCVSPDELDPEADLKTEVTDLVAAVGHIEQAFAARPPRV